MFLGAVFILVVLTTNVGRLFATLVAPISQVFVSPNVAGLTKIVLALAAAATRAMLNVLGVLVLRLVRWAGTIVAVDVVEVVLSSQVLNDVVPTIERRSTTAVIGQQRIVATKVTVVGYPWLVSNIVEVRCVPVTVEVVTTTWTDEQMRHEINV